MLAGGGLVLGATYADPKVQALLIEFGVAALMLVVLELVMAPIINAVANDYNAAIEEHKEYWLELTFCRRAESLTSNRMRQISLRRRPENEYGARGLRSVLERIIACRNRTGIPKSVDM